MIVVVLILLLNVFGTQEYTPTSAAVPRLVLFWGLVMLRRLLLLVSPFLVVVLFFLAL